MNSVHGHRRLNVLFSRAKEKIVTYTSMKPTDIQAEGKQHGVAMLRAWLEFSRTGRLGDIQSGRKATDSPFEDYVIAQIEAAGYEAVPQVGASGYQIDIGVRHPDWPYGFILGVECDGAPYHSSRSSRDRDRLRQQVLEGLGWHFYRIWSTDWFRDPRTQIEKLQAALDAALARVLAEDARRREARDRAHPAAPGFRYMLGNAGETEAASQDAHRDAIGGNPPSAHVATGRVLAPGSAAPDPTSPEASNPVEPLGRPTPGGRVRHAPGSGFPGPEPRAQGLLFDLPRASPDPARRIDAAPAGEPTSGVDGASDYSARTDAAAADTPPPQTPAPATPGPDVAKPATEGGGAEGSTQDDPDPGRAPDTSRGALRKDDA